MRNTILGLAAAATMLCAQVVSAAEPAPAATMKTVFVSKGSASSVTKAVNRLHAEMEAEGWTVQGVAVYTEDGDLEGLFVTYVRPPAAKTVPAS